MKVLRNVYEFVSDLAGRYPDDGLSNLTIKVAKKRIHHAEILKLKATPIEVIKGVPGQIIMALNTIVLVNKTTPYTESDDNLNVGWFKGSSRKGWVAEFETTALITGASNFQAARAIQNKTDHFGPTFSDIAGASLSAANRGNAEFGGGAAGQWLDIVVGYFLLSEEDYTF